MNIGFVGLGKLGLPCALALESKGHKVWGADPSEEVARILASRRLPYREEGAGPLLEMTSITHASVKEVVRASEVIFVAVQTPHDPRYEGVTPVPETRADFNYAHLCEAVRQVAEVVAEIGAERTVVVISTVLPGTVRRYVRPVVQRVFAGAGGEAPSSSAAAALDTWGVPSSSAAAALDTRKGLVRLVYNPFFIAMGTTIRDFLEPEFVLLGADDADAAERVKRLYATVHDRPVFTTTIENAELTKVAYNTFIGMKVAFANTLMEACHKLPGTDCDAVVDALSLATERLISPKYLRGGMGDGGGCHPRDNIALSWLAERLSLSHDLFADVMAARDDQTEWLADLIVEEKRASLLPVVLLGEAFKAGTNLTTGSPARLLAHYLTRRDVIHEVYDPHTIAFARPFGSSPWASPSKPAIFFIGVRHEEWRSYAFPEGSIVLDPFRYLGENPSIQRCRYVPIGIGPVTR